MNAWLTDASNIPNHDNGTFNGTIDPSMAFLQPSQAPQDPTQFQRMFQNGVPRNVSPSFHNPNQVIPSKRPRPEDGISMSPRQAPGGLPVSRSQTPQVPYPGYQGPANGNPQFAQPSPYQHLHQQQQRGPLNPSQSPGLQDFDQHGVQKMHTSSPSPFSPAGPVANQISTPQSDHGSRVNTPQNNTFMPGQAFPQGITPQFAQQAAMTSGATSASMQAQLGNMPQGFSPQAMAAQQQRLYQMQLQNQARQMQVNNPAMVGRPAGAMNPMVNPQMAALRQMQHNMSQPNISKANSPELFLKTLQKFMMNRNLPLDLNPVVSGRPIHLMPLYGTVMKMGGSKKISATNMWPTIAQALQFPVQQYPNAAAEIREIYAKNLAPYEHAILVSTHQQKQMDSMQQNALQRQSADPNLMQFQQSPVKAVPEFDAQGSQQFIPSPQVTATMSSSMSAAATNGLANAQQPRQPKQPPQQPQLPHGQSGQRTVGQRQAQVPASLADSSLQSQVAPQPGASAKPAASTGKLAPDSTPNKPIKHHIDETFKATVLPDNHKHGPVVIDEIYQLGEEIARLKPNVPSFPELGVIDIHALTMSIKSGIHAEVRLALDTLMTLSSEPAVLSLDNCDDLVESLVDCAEEQLDLLAENAAEVSDDMLLPSYEEVIRGCHVEMASLLDVPEFGSLGYELDRAADRVLCITAIIRNFSFSELNFGILGSAPVITMFSTIIRYLGTRNMLLRTNQNILDFMKDAVTYLSNIAQTVNLPGKEEAFCLLHFLLSFSPLPTPVLGSEGVTFTQYVPSIHKYTPAATDSLAKLLARDEPNRMYFKTIFQESQCSPQNELLTRAFGMAICAVPDQPRKSLAFSDSRKVFLMQGLLAAEILTGLADGITARTWLQSTDGTDRIAMAPTPRHPQARGQPDSESNPFVSIVNRGLSILRKLAERSKQEDSISEQPFPLCVLPKRESLLGAMLTPHLDAAIVKQLIAYAGLGN
ncbi:ARID/BRIGHT domain protein (SWI1), putative [Talaromyces stipitatus ATCC 10500]|uniref:ARID/BRIGHT domain protein (SWI1), putative n=1 Tax=Talaromyces stipitatus (strain ATCC 10500 / CBS 375.48 / QM 6759 / NRRL 1006) TaxID=441959 RepID=B8M4Z4_TALSN|nr:ARID/BRIGHT domain protein (SWI1), putative [Talaromyces stipitatus ATCC 10500]EED19429.1 ARID/BRIGHT domain protein (SWI1), putative [Talaromyces stipitatus ATCC 10500]